MKTPRTLRRIMPAIGATHKAWRYISITQPPDKRAAAVQRPVCLP
jgi:hypothetical protein